MSVTRLVDVGVTVNGVTLRAQEVEIEAISEDDDVTVTTGEPANEAIGVASIGTKATLTDVIGVRVRVRNGSYDAAENLFSGAVNIKAGNYCTLAISPDKISLGQSPWLFPSFAVLRVMQGGRIPGPNPVTFEGKSDGGFSYCN